ncbi:MAG: acyl-CoA dehydrogenase, partial [bacterium]|nr:acyl-CoA dehydrogenase [bacterium]
MASIEDFKQEVRSFIEANLPAQLRVGNRKDLPGALLGKWITALSGRGWITPEWPTEYGGGGLDRKHAAALKAEFKAVRAPIISSFGTSMLGPTLLEFGNEAQKKEFLPPISRHEIKWCQGYSEPGAGSDLA